MYTPEWQMLWHDFPFAQTNKDEKWKKNYVVLTHGIVSMDWKSPAAKWREDLFETHQHSNVFFKNSRIKNSISKLLPLWMASYRLTSHSPLKCARMRDGVEMPLYKMTKCIAWASQSMQVPSETVVNFVSQPKHLLCKQRECDITENYWIETLRSVYIFISFLIFPALRNWLLHLTHDINSILWFPISSFDAINYFH